MAMRIGDSRDGAPGGSASVTRSPTKTFVTQHVESARQKPSLSISWNRIKQHKAAQFHRLRRTAMKHIGQSSIVAGMAEDCNAGQHPTFVKAKTKTSCRIGSRVVMFLDKRFRSAISFQHIHFIKRWINNLSCWTVRCAVLPPTLIHDPLPRSPRLHLLLLVLL